MLFITGTNTFAQKTKLFWQSFKKKSRELQSMLNDVSSHGAVELVSEILHEYIPGIGFLLGRQDDNFEFYFSPEGNKDHQILVRYCLSHIPLGLKGWRFYNSKQPNIHGHSYCFSIYGKEFAIKDFVLQYTLYGTKLNVSVYNPMFADLSISEQTSVAFIMLQDVLGEYGTELWIADITTSTKSFPDSFIALEQLPLVIESIKKEHELGKDLTPDQVWHSYKMENPDPHNYDRGDIIAGVTTHVPLLNNDCIPMEPLGADYIYLVINSEQFDKSEIVRRRNYIEDILHKRMAGTRHGYVIGGATGINNVYIDLVIFDGPKTIKMLKAIFKRKLPKVSYKIKYFKDRSK